MIFKRKRGVTLSPIAHHLGLGLRYWQQVGLCYNFLGLWFSPVSHVSTNHALKGSPGKEAAGGGNGIAGGEGLSAVWFEGDYHIPDEELMPGFAVY